MGSLRGMSVCHQEVSLIHESLPNVEENRTQTGQEQASTL